MRHLFMNVAKAAVEPYSQEHLLGNLSSEKVEIVRDSTKSTLKRTFLSFKFLPHFGECLSEVFKSSMIVLNVGSIK